MLPYTIFCRSNVWFLTILFLILFPHVAFAKSYLRNDGNATKVTTTSYTEEQVLKTHKDNTNVPRKLQEIISANPGGSSLGTFNLDPLPIKNNRPAHFACGMAIWYNTFQQKTEIMVSVGLRFCSRVNWGSNQITNSAIWDELYQTSSLRPAVMCPENAFIVGTQVQGESRTNVNTHYCGIRMICKNFETNVQTTVDVHVRDDPSSYEKILYGVNRFWYDTVYFPNDQVIKGFQPKRYVLKSFDGGLVSTLPDIVYISQLNFITEKINYGVSEAPIRGFWQIVASAAGVEVMVTVSFSLTHGETVTDEQSYGFTEEVSAGIDFIVDTSVRVEAQQSRTISQQLSQSFEQTVSTTMTLQCPRNNGESTTNYAYQWVMEQESDEFGPGFLMKANHLRCTNKGTDSPRCPLFFCDGNTCQQCLEPFQDMGISS